MAFLSVGALEQPTKTILSFWERRLHSLAGLGITLYLFFHLLTNAKVAFGVDGRAFIEAVNAIHTLPFLTLIEIVVLGVPIAIHAILGVRYLQLGKFNSFSNTGRDPYLEYGRNRAYSWQRITSWLLLIGILAHVVHMRFIEYPGHLEKEGQKYFTVHVMNDPGLQGLAERLNVKLHTSVSDEHLAPEERVALAPNFGTAELLMVRESFKSPFIMLLYTIFVLAACFHAFNGLWTFLITWGVTLTVQSQRISLYLSTFLMALVTFFGLVAIYGNWINLRL